VKVISIDTERRRIGLSMRQLQKDPWEDSVEDYHVGQLVEGTITRLVKFGAFARIDDHVEGLIHISELSENRIEHPKEVVKEGDKLALRVIKIEPDRRRIGLSLRKVDSAQYSDQDYEAAMAAAGELNGSQKTAEPAGETSAPEETSPEDPSQPFGETITVEAKAVANAPEEPEAPASIGEEEK